MPGPKAYLTLMDQNIYNSASYSHESHICQLTMVFPTGKWSNSSGHPNAPIHVLQLENQWVQTKGNYFLRQHPSQLMLPFRLLIIKEIVDNSPNDILLEMVTFFCLQSKTRSSNMVHINGISKGKSCFKLGNIL